jgi:transcriptional regulator with XRE-family HTH domain
MTPHQCEIARSALGWSVEDLASRARVSMRVVRRWERHGEIGQADLESLWMALTCAGVSFPGEGRAPDRDYPRWVETIGDAAHRAAEFTFGKCRWVWATLWTVLWIYLLMVACEAAQQLQPY